MCVCVYIHTHTYIYEIYTLNQQIIYLTITLTFFVFSVVLKIGLEERKVKIVLIQDEYLELHFALTKWSSLFFFFNVYSVLLRVCLQARREQQISFEMVAGNWTQELQKEEQSVLLTSECLSQSKAPYSYQRLSLLSLYYRTQGISNSAYSILIVYVNKLMVFLKQEQESKVLSFLRSYLVFHQRTRSICYWITYKVYLLILLQPAFLMFPSMCFWSFWCCLLFDKTGFLCVALNIVKLAL